MSFLEETYLTCLGCGDSFNSKDIMPSGLCVNCSFVLIAAFLRIPEKVIKEIHNIQRREHNNPCFSTGKKETCGQVKCEWWEICDVKVKVTAGEKVV